MSTCTEWSAPPSAIEQPSVLPEPAPARLLCAPPGTGKTYAVIRSLVEDGTRAIYAAPTHELCREVTIRMQAAGLKVHYWRPGPTPEDGCPYLDLVEFYRGFGYHIRKGPCLHCPKKTRCTYRAVFTSSANWKAQVLVLTGWHLQREDFWTLRATADRNLVILDEDATQMLASPTELRFDSLARFVAGLQAIREQCGDPFRKEERSDVEAWLIRKLIKPAGGDDAGLALTDLLRRACMDLMTLCPRYPDGRWLPEPPFGSWLTAYDRTLLENDDLFASQLAMAYEAIKYRVELPNLFARLRDLLLHTRPAGAPLATPGPLPSHGSQSAFGSQPTPGSQAAEVPLPLYVSRGAVRWTSVSRIPPERRLVLLDATAEPSVVGGVLARPVEALTIPPVRQEARIYQVMDRLLTRSGTRQDIADDDGFILTFLREAAAKHQKDRLLVVTFLEHEEKLRDFLAGIHSDATVVHYGALRGLDAFGDYGAGVIIGRPMPNEARLGLLAVSAFGTAALSPELLPPELEWTQVRYPLHDTVWQVRCQRYANPLWEAVWRHVVSGEIIQAVGRLRPLTNPGTVYILTSEPVPEQLRIEGVYAGELFPSMALVNRRDDFQKHVREYASAWQSLKSEGHSPTNKAVCERIGMKAPNGLRYKKIALDYLNDPNMP